MNFAGSVISEENSAYRVAVQVLLTRLESQAMKAGVVNPPDRFSALKVAPSGRATAIQAALPARVVIPGRHFQQQ